MQETIESLAYKWGFPFLRKRYGDDRFFLSNDSALCKKSIIFITLKNNSGRGLYLTKKIEYINWSNKSLTPTVLKHE